tara:strand:- start:52 stop:444 length:393 start_codon:yes stop_codon:yes gene_type:complete
MANTQTIETFLARTGIPYRGVDDGTWILDDEGDEIPPMVIGLAPPLIVFNCRVAPVTESTGTDQLHKLLELNATEMTAGAYGVTDGWVVVTETLQSENLDYNEFNAAVEGIVMSLSSHYAILKGLVDANA